MERTISVDLLEDRQMRLFSVLSIFTKLHNNYTIDHSGQVFGDA